MSGEITDLDREMFGEGWCNAVTMCREECDEIYGLAHCEVCPLAVAWEKPLHRKRRVVYGDRFVQKWREISGDHRFPLRVIK